MFNKQLTRVEGANSSETPEQMQRLCPVLALTVRAVSSCARTHVFPSSFPPTVRLAFIQRASFAKKSGGKGDAAADFSKATVAPGSGKNSASKSGSKNEDGDNVNAEAEMEAIIAKMKCARVSQSCYVSEL